jgi:hypothetical protein
LKQVLVSAIVSGALVIGLFLGFPVGYVARNFVASQSGSDIALPQKK